MKKGTEEDGRGREGEREGLRPREGGGGSEGRERGREEGREEGRKGGRERGKEGESKSYGARYVDVMQHSRRFPDKATCVREGGCL